MLSGVSALFTTYNRRGFGTAISCNSLSLAHTDMLCQIPVFFSSHTFGRCRYFSFVAIPPRIWRSDLFISSTCLTRSASALSIYCILCVSLCTVDLLIPNCFAACRTVAWCSTIYSAISIARSSICFCVFEPSM